MGLFGPRTWSEQARADERDRKRDVRDRKRRERDRKARRRQEWTKHPVRTAWRSR